MNALLAVFLYEWRRSLTSARIAWWFVMAGFPVMITLLVLSISNFEQGVQEKNRDTFWSMAMYVLVPCVCSALSVLLTAGPAVATELEQRSWVYMATRPNGIFWLMIGKYLVAVTWGTSAAWAGCAVSLALSNAISKVEILLTMGALSLLSCISYSAVYLLIGVISPKRAMVFSVMYTGFVEVVLGFIPALVNRLTVQFRLRSLLVKWAPIDSSVEKSPAFTYVFGDDAAYMHIIWLMALVSLFFAAALVIAHRREFTTATEGDM